MDKTTYEDSEIYILTNVTVITCGSCKRKYSILAIDTDRKTWNQGNNSAESYCFYCGEKLNG